MTSTLVATKLFVPRLRSSVVERDRLTARLRATAEVKLTLVSAPAGFGKTTAVAAWLAASPAEERAVAWVSLEDGDDRAISFWTYVVAGLHAAVPEIGAGLLPLLQSGQAPTRALLTTLINEIGDQSVDIDLVLDDYHRADGSEVAVGMTYLIDHLPPNLHLVISTRADPDLPLARLRARGELVEVRVRDLRFTEAEIATYLSDVGGLDVNAPDVTTLTGKTEGWAAALQLATLSMQGRDDVTGFVAGFAGDDSYVVDYLADEVLSRQPDDVRQFLLRTSVLDRLSGDLCDAVTGQPGGRSMLESLDRANLFLVRLDDRRHWYRYHHLFGDVLRAHLDADHPGEATTLHRRAADWYAAEGATVPAVRHALAAGDDDRAADLVEAAVPALGRARAETTLRGWVDCFPREVLRRRPLLALGLVGGLMQGNEFGPAQELLADVERWLPAIRARLGLAPEDGPPDDGVPAAADLVFVDLDSLARVPANVEMYRAALALVHGDPAATIRHAQRVRVQAMPDDQLALGAAAALSGLARWGSGDLESAHEQYSTSVVHLLRAGHVADVLGCTITLADLRIAQGRLSDALAAYDEGLRRAGDGVTPLRGAADMHTGLAEIALERGDHETARQQLLHSRELGEPLSLGQNPYRLRASSAALAEADGDLATARELLVEAEQVYLGDFSPDVRPLHARIARLDVARRDLDAALAWAVQHDVTADQPLTYAREFEHITLAEVLLAKHRLSGDAVALEDSVDLLTRLLAQAEAGGRTANLVDVLVLMALAADAGRQGSSADAALRRALGLAEVEGHVRVFARHGTLVVPLLERIHAGTATFGARILSALARSSSGTPDSPDVLLSSVSVQPTDALVEPLSPRELEVLRLLASDLDGPGIARHLVVSVHTLRTHTKNIYAKLGVSSRRAALRRAHELGLPLSG
jgi:LuxR family transcriptional regulator, maltose regulon positive regulatory protein